MTSHNLFTSGRLRTATLAMVAAAALALTGCNFGSAPNDGGSASPSSSATESVTPSATPTPPPSAAYRPADATGRAQNVPVPILPEVAKTETKEGALAFVGYWFEQLNFAYQTGEITGIQAVTSSSCQFCTNVTGSLTTNYEGGRWLTGGKIVVPSATTTFERGTDGNYQVIVQVQQTAINYYESGGSEFRTVTQPSDTGNVLLINFKNSQWHVNGLHPLR